MCWLIWVHLSHLRKGSLQTLTLSSTVDKNENSVNHEMLLQYMGDFRVCNADLCTIIEKPNREYILEGWWSIPKEELHAEAQDLNCSCSLWWPDTLLRHFMLVFPFICVFSVVVQHNNWITDNQGAIRNAA